MLKLVPLPEIKTTRGQNAPVVGDQKLRVHENTTANFNMREWLNIFF